MGGFSYHAFVVSAIVASLAVVARMLPAVMPLLLLMVLIMRVVPCAK
jgi:hypothetical protein